jgi:hypothetical protein
MAFPVAPFLYLASAIRREIEVPVFHAQDITDLHAAIIARAGLAIVADAQTVMAALRGML